jgi:YVTN family beta-propeller protein
MAQSNRPEPSEFLVFPIVDLDLMVFFRGSDITRPLYGSYKEFIKQLTKSITPASALLLQTNSVNNPTQTLLNLIQGSGITITDDGLGGITITATGGGGGTYTANNGLTENPANNFQLGSTVSGGAPLLHDTYINTLSDKTLFLEGQKNIQNEYILQIINSVADGGALNVSTLGLGNAIRATSISASAISANSTNAAAIAATTGGSTESGLFTNSDAGTNNIVQSIKLRHSSSGVPTNGFGVSIDFTGKTTLNSDLRLGRLIFLWTDAITASRTSKFQIETVNSAAASVKLEVDGDGEVTLNNYGTGTFISTPAYALGADATGKIVEFAVPSGGTVLTEDSVQGDGTFGNEIKLVNDSATPGVNKVYGTDSSGAKAWKDDPIYPAGLIPGSIVGSYACYTNSQSHEIVQSHDRLWVASTGNNRIDVYEASTGKLITGFTLTNVIGVMYNEHRDEVWATISSSGNIKRYDPITGLSAGADITGSGTSGVSYYEYSATKVFICNSGSNTITVVNPTTLAVDATITAGTLSITQPRNICYVDNVSSAHNGYITGVSFSDNKLFAIDAATNAVAISGVVVASFSNPTSIDYNPVNDRYYVASYSGSDLVVLNAATSTTVTFDTSFFGRNLRSVVCDKLTGFTYSASLCNNLSNWNGSVYLQCFDTNGIKWATVTPCDAVATSYFYGYLSIDTVGKFLYCNAVSLFSGKWNVIRVKI